MGILDGIVEWIAEQVMNGLDLISVSVLGALGCDMGTFLRYFPAAETMYHIFVATAIGLVLLNWVWQLFKNFGVIAGVEAEDPVRLSIRSVLFIGLIYYCDQITDMILAIGAARPIPGFCPRTCHKGKTPKNQRFRGFYQRRRPDLNRCVLVLQTIALPLGYCAILHYMKHYHIQ